MLLEAQEDIEVVAEAGSVRDAIFEARATRPDVILMDVEMDEMNGIAATREIVGARADAKVVILTTFEEDDYIFGALRAGAAGFLLKRTSPEELIHALHTVSTGDSLLSPPVTRRVIERMAKEPAPEAASSERLHVLTAREREVLELVARGLSNGEIARNLVIEESTVKTHVKRILMKLRLRDRVQAVILAYESGLVRPGSGA
jgi:DNA-binding NarL/FixJ family response regulator